MAFSPNLFVDGNGRSITHPFGMRPMEGAANIKSATMGAATAEVVISAMPFALNERGSALVRVATDGQGALFAFGAAGAAASFTGIANMTMLPPNSVTYVHLNISQDVSFYHLQLGVAGNIQLQLMR